jgi:glycosyltransferase involved in cell wall biosynthesis
VLIVSLGSTEGLRRADDELHDSLVRAGARVAMVRAKPPAPTRTLMLTDLAWARAARAVTLDALAHMRGSRPGAIVYSSTTAALLWPAPGAIRFDATAAGNRRGRHGYWQRPLERRRLAQAPLLLPWSEPALEEAPAAARLGGRAVVLPVPVEASGGRAADAAGAREARTPDGEPLVPASPPRDIAAITYAANPAKKGLDRVLGAWRAVRTARAGSRGGDDELVVAGATAEELERAGVSLRPGDGVRVVGALGRADYRALVRRARVFVCAPRREDYGISQLEALAEGCLLVTTPAPGPYPALALARSLDARLVGEDLEGALRLALEAPPPEYASRAAAALVPFGREAVDRVVAGELLARLLASAPDRTH